MKKGPEEIDEQQNIPKQDRVEEGKCIMSYEKAKGMERKKQCETWENM